MRNDYKPEGKKPWEQGFADEEFSQKQDYRRAHGDKTDKFVDREPNKEGGN